MVPKYLARPYDGAADLLLLIEFAKALGRTTSPPYYHPGDFVWQLYEFDTTEDARLWLDGDEVVACAIFEPPLTFQFSVHPAIIEHDELTAEVLDWVAARRALVNS